MRSSCTPEEQEIIPRDAGSTAKEGEYTVGSQAPKKACDWLGGGLDSFYPMSSV